MTDNDHILLFDGICNLCNSLVKFIIKIDPRAKFKFATLQSTNGQILLKRFDLPVTEINSIVYIKGEIIYLKSSAILYVFKELGGFWKFLYIFILIPKFIRDYFYQIIAKTRYKIFGKRLSCMIPYSDINQRFLT